MPKRKYYECQGCGVDHREIKLNRKGYCESCALYRQDESAQDMMNKSGEFYDKWLLGMAHFANRERLKRISLADSDLSTQEIG